ncbi:MFS transporter [Acidisoma sp.]|uniref:MFS transporter n=1 Tax=Acidisoma sp. TaxID=1872115 RepID=UPI003B00D745
MAGDARTDVRALFARPYGIYLATFSLGSALYAFSAFLVAACMPSAIKSLGHLGLISWGFTFYLIAAIVAGTLASQLKRRLGTADALQWAAACFLAGTLACGLAPDIWLLLVGRVLQGLGEGAISGLTYMLIPEVFPAALIPAVFGIEAVIWASGSTAGPILGGFLTQALSWRAAFLAEVPMVLAFMLLVRVNIPRRASALPVHGLAMARLLGVGLAILLLSLAAIEPQLWMRAASALASIGLLVVLSIRDQQALNRLLPAGAFSWGSALGLAFWVVLLMPAASTGPTTYTILMLERIWGFRPLAASILGAAPYITWSIIGVLASRIPASLSSSCLWAGPTLLALGLGAGMVAMPSESLSLLMASLVCVGTGYGLSWGFLSQAIMTRAGPGDRDRASAMLPTVLSTGLAIGAALGGVAANSAGLTDRAPPAVVAQAGLFCFTVGVVVGIGAVLAGLRLRLLVRDFAPAQ